jgi:glycerophosphoryl diester phosphodiesterase
MCTVSPAQRPLVYAHRGGGALRPENTIPSFDNGLALGADGLEFDVHLSRDGVVVVHHDALLDRTTSGRGPLAALTADELAALDAGHWFRGMRDAAAEFPFRGTGIGIPKLRDVLVRYPGVPMIIELKVNHPDLAKRAVDEVRAADAVERVSFGSFGWRVLHALRQYEPGISTGASREEARLALYRSWIRWPSSRPRAYREFQLPERSGATTIISPRFIDYAHRAGLPVKVWTVNESADVRRLAGWGVDGIITDRPDVAVGVVRGLSATQQ